MMRPGIEPRKPNDTKLFVIRIVTWSYNYLQRIILVNWNDINVSKLFVLKIVTWNCNYLQKIIIYYFYLLLYGGARGVMVIVAGIGHGDMSSNPGRDWLHFT